MTIFQLFYYESVILAPHYQNIPLLPLFGVFFD